MKNIKFNLTKFLFILTFFVFHVSLLSRFNINEFNISNVISSIKYLTSDELEGRLCGEEGNILAQKYILNKFKENSLLPYNLKYLQDFNVFYPKKIEGQPYLTITNKSNNIIKSFEYNRDFKDTFLNFRANNISFSKEDTVSFNSSALAAKTSTGEKVVFISTSMDNFDFRSSFDYNSTFDLYVNVSPKTFEEIKVAYENEYNINCFFPYIAEETTVNNIVGVIKGSNSSLSPLVLTAHFDHLGVDLDGNIYRGALDNASGISFLLELASFLSSLPTPDRDIIFVALNAEEFGLLGSSSFANENKNTLQGAKVINFDMIGSDDGIPITLMTGENEEFKSGLLDSLISYCKNNKIAYLIENKDSSDHASFLNNGIDSVTINDGDISKIHTKYDTLEYISESAINRAFLVAISQIYNYAYNPLTLLLLENTSLIILGLILFLLFILLLMIDDKNAKKVK